MAEISNELTWSISRGQCFSNCLRAYYYTYYGSWGGWSRNADEKTRLLYTLKNIKTLLLWAGSIVHETIRETLIAFRERGIKPSLSELQDAAVIKMRNGWLECIHKAWVAQPKKTNLFELYYGDGENYGECRQLPREMTDAVKQRVLDCMEGFHFSPIVRTIYDTPPTNWMPVDELDSFELDGIKVWSAPDFAFRDDNGAFHILDWKTGSENRTSITQQLACYAMYAIQKWNIPLESIRIHGVFLKDGGRVQDYGIQQSSLATVRQQILESFQAMRSKLKDAEHNVAAEEDFPPQPSEYGCSHCPFRRVCLSL